MSRRLGLVIGINQCQDPTFQPLAYAENDARALAGWLANEKGGRWSPSDIQLVQGDQVTRESAETLISQICLQVAEPGDLVLLYFAGHAFLDERSGDSYLALANTRYQDPTTALHLLSFVHYITAQSKAAQILVILDCYQTGRQWSTRRASAFDFRPLFSQQLQATLLQQSDRVFFCSCRGNEYAPESGERNLGTFIYRTIVGCSGPVVDPATKGVALHNLQAYLAQTTSEQHQPQIFGQQQSPIWVTGPMPQSSETPPPSSSQMYGSPNTSTQGYATSPSAAQAALAASAIATAQPVPQRPQTPTTSTQHEVTTGADQQQMMQLAQLQEQAQMLLQAQRYPEVLALIDRMLAINPNDSATLIRKGQILGTMGNYQEAFGIVQQLLYKDATNPMVWSMQAVLLSNMGQYKEALEAIEHSLELDAGNTETFAIKTDIMERMAVAQSQQSEQGKSPTARYSNKPEKKRSGPLSFLIGAGVQIAGVLLGLGGMMLPILRPELPVYIGQGAASLGLALLCVNAARGAYLFGILRLLFVLFISVLLGGLLFAGYRFGYAQIVNQLIAHPPALQPGLMLAGWLVLATVLPPVLGIGGLLLGLILGVRKSKQ